MDINKAPVLNTNESVLQYATDLANHFGSRQLAADALSHMMAWDKRLGRSVNMSVRDTYQALTDEDVNIPVRA